MSAGTDKISKTAAGCGRPAPTRTRCGFMRCARSNLRRDGPQVAREICRCVDSLADRVERVVRNSRATLTARILVSSDDVYGDLSVGGQIPRRGSLTFPERGGQRSSFRFLVGLRERKQSTSKSCWVAWAVIVREDIGRGFRSLEQLGRHSIVSSIAGERTRAGVRSDLILA